MARRAAMDRIRIGVVLLALESTHDGCRIRIPEGLRRTVMDPGSYTGAAPGSAPGVGRPWGPSGARVGKDGPGNSYPPGFPLSAARQGAYHGRHFQRSPEEKAMTAISQSVDLDR